MNVVASEPQSVCGDQRTTLSVGPCFLPYLIESLVTQH